MERYTDGSNNEFSCHNRVNILKDIRSNYALGMVDYMNQPESQSFIIVDALYAKYVKEAIKPTYNSVYNPEDGELKTNILKGITEVASHEMVINKLITLDCLLNKTFQDPVQVTVTEDIPQFALKMREIFPSMDDAVVAKACNKGFIQGWNRVLGLVGRQDIPLLLYPKSVYPKLICRSVDPALPKSAVLPTALEGVNARYQYASEFSLPYVSLVVKPPQAF